ncbi:MAG: helix-turn-helix domain-containing protein [Nocardioidaceae bacterium]
MALQFRNLDITSAAPVEQWGLEGLLAALDRGERRDWRRIMSSVERDPWGDVAQTLAEAFELAEDSGVVNALREALAMIRKEREAQERAAVAAELRACMESASLSQDAFARRLGTSRSRLNTYLHGRVTPSATLLVRARAIAQP